MAQEFVARSDWVFEIYWHNIYLYLLYTDAFSFMKLQQTEEISKLR